jgi:hypothetical protein
MPPIRNVSFVPTQTDPNKVEAEPSDPLTALGIIFFAVAVIFSLVGFGVTYYLEGKNTDLRNNIQAVEANLKNVPLDEMLSFYSKTQNINSVLKEHVYVTTVLSLLENAVESNVYFKKFEFSFREGAGYDLSISGIAPDTRSVVRQIDVLKDQKYAKVFKTVELKNVTKDKLENITFDIKIVVIPTIKNEAFDFIPADKITIASSTEGVIATTSTKAVVVPVSTTTPSSSIPLIKNPL